MQFLPSDMISERDLGSSKWQMSVNIGSIRDRSGVSSVHLLANHSLSCVIMPYPHASNSNVSP